MKKSKRKTRSDKFPLTLHPKLLAKQSIIHGDKSTLENTFFCLDNG
jgi:hypothetical protein